MAEEAEAGTREYEDDPNPIQKIEEEADAEKKVGEKSMTPWEQHSAVITLPRFDYTAPSSILQYSHCGFLVTCTIKREKSATKEVMSILEKKKYFRTESTDSPVASLRQCSSFFYFSRKNLDYGFYCCLFLQVVIFIFIYVLVILLGYVEPFKSGGFDGLENPEKFSTSKRRRTCTEDIGTDCLDLEETNTAVVNSGEGKHTEGTHLSPTKAETNIGRLSDFSLVKLTRSGLLLFTFPRNASPDTVGIVANIIQSLESGSISSPVWCHRIFPIQATCSLNEKELQEVVSALVKKFVADKQNQLGRPLKFAVGYNRRGIEDTKFLKGNANSSSAYSLLDRNKCFSVVASAVKLVVEDSVVDLKCPELSVLVEWLPLSGLPSGSIIVAVSVLPINLVSTKPKLCIKALTSKTKQGSGSQ